eukprot:jgi/Botrbrau1/12956/Bobra.154_2s0016.1
MNSGGISRSRGKGRSSPPPDIDQSKFAGANVTITPSTPKGGQAKRKSGRTWGTEGQPWGVATLILLAIALQLIILVRMGIDNVLPSLLKPLWNRAGSQGSNQGSSRQGETVAGVANGIFPVGCKWRDIQQKDGSGAFWKVEQYEYWDASRSAWSSKQPSSCLVQGIKNPINWQWHNNLPIHNGGVYGNTLHLSTTSGTLSSPSTLPSVSTTYISSASLTRPFNCHSPTPHPPLPRSLVRFACFFLSPSFFVNPIRAAWESVLPCTFNRMESSTTGFWLTSSHVLGDSARPKAACTSYPSTTPVRR